MKWNRILVGDVLDRLADLPERSVDTVVTSPPYFQLRDYGMPGQIGLEATPQLWVGRMLDVAAELARVLSEHGTWWLNLGDSYSRGGKVGVAPKSLVLAPERLLIALADRGWIVRNKVVWAKTNPVPASVTDRLACTWEPVYLLTRSHRYHFDLDAIRQPHRSRPPSAARRAPPHVDRSRPKWAGPLSGDQHGLQRLKSQGLRGHPLGKNPGDVWSMVTARYPGARVALLPQPLIERILRAACPEAVCTCCNRPVANRSRLGRACTPACDCGGMPRRGRVLDPFIGTGSTAIAARRLERDWLGIELNPGTAALANKRISSVAAKEAA